jgi:hypothetical protein
MDSSDIAIFTDFLEKIPFADERNLYAVCGDSGKEGENGLSVYNSNACSNDYISDYTESCEEETICMGYWIPEREGVSSLDSSL